MSQSDSATYGYKLTIAQPGQLADVGPHRIDSFAAETASSIAFGSGLTRGTDKEKQCQLIDNAADAFLGVAVFNHLAEQGFSESSSPSSVAASIKDGDTVDVLREGRVYVKTAGAVTAGASAYVDPATGIFTASSSSTVGPVGKFQGTLGASGGVVACDIIR